MRPTVADGETAPHNDGRVKPVYGANPPAALQLNSAQASGQGLFRGARGRLPRPLDATVTASRPKPAALLVTVDKVMRRAGLRAVSVEEGIR
jgi:hypothetical protein